MPGMLVKGGVTAHTPGAQDPTSLSQWTLLLGDVVMIGGYRYSGASSQSVGPQEE